MSDASEKTCFSCRFCSVAYAGSGPTVGECHRYPPIHQSKFGAEGAFFPFVEEDDWCGEWKAAE
jgi:hypothetical protein